MFYTIGARVFWLVVLLVGIAIHAPNAQAEFNTATMHGRGMGSFQFGGNVGLLKGASGFDHKYATYDLQFGLGVHPLLDLEFQYQLRNLDTGFYTHAQAEHALEVGIKQLLWKGYLAMELTFGMNYSDARPIGDLPNTFVVRPAIIGSYTPVANIVEASLVSKFNMQPLSPSAYGWEFGTTVRASNNLGKWAFVPAFSYLIDFNGGPGNIRVGAALEFRFQVFSLLSTKEYGSKQMIRDLNRR